jgi:tRNA A37 threonylcarbamoyladenosine synthetase subunit TsaC/SUA5/YrdC
MDAKALYLVQTDTTVGFLSQDRAKLLHVKKRDSDKEFLKVYGSFKSFKNDSNRIANRHKSYVRSSKKTTFISKNRASRIVQESQHQNFLKNFDYLFSTSANESGKSYNYDFVKGAAEVIVETKDGFNENRASKMIKLSNKKKVRLR